MPAEKQSSPIYQEKQPDKLKDISISNVQEDDVYEEDEYVSDEA